MERLKNRLGVLSTPIFKEGEEKYGGDSYQPKWSEKLNQLFPAPPTKIAPSLRRQRGFPALTTPKTEAQLLDRTLTAVLKDNHPEEYRDCKHRVLIARLAAIEKRRNEIHSIVTSMEREDYDLQDEAADIKHQLKAFGFGSHDNSVEHASPKRINVQMQNSPKKPITPQTASPPMAPVKPESPPRSNQWHRVPVMRMSSVNWDSDGSFSSLEGGLSDDDTLKSSQSKSPVKNKQHG